ncbi:protein jag [Lusitaniella coriacea]|uniref:Jag family protein n=1 Tax=Lusitaniella coriacea TaxID=1983105 RepID=UPI003CF37583
MSDPVQRGQEWLATLLKQMGFSCRVDSIIPNGSDDAAVWLKIDEAGLHSGQVRDLIGEGGKTIDALQYLTNTLLNIGVEPEEQKSFTVELDGYRVKRQEELEALVQEVAQRVRTTGQEEVLKSLSSAERRQVHNLFADYEDLQTESQGAEPDRRLIVRLSSQKDGEEE